MEKMNSLRMVTVILNKQGHKYLSISLAWTNLLEEDATAILEAVKPATFTCNYFFGTMKEDIFKCSSPKLTLKLVYGDKRYYDLSLKLEG